MSDHLGRNAGRRIFIGVALLALIAIIFLLPVIFPRAEGVYEAYYSRENFERLFFHDLGWSESLSSLLAILCSFFYALAWVPLFWWTYRIVLGRYSARQLIAAFVSFAFIYGFAPAARTLFGSDVCFDQQTGEPIKWYTEAPDGTITLFDRGGFDPWTGAEKRPVTPDICLRYLKQEALKRAGKVAFTIKVPHCALAKRFVFAGPAADVTWSQKHDSGWFSDTDQYGLQFTLEEMTINNCWLEQRVTYGDPNAPPQLVPVKEEVGAPLSVKGETYSTATITAKICNKGQTGILYQRSFFAWYVPDTQNMTVTWQFGIDDLATGACETFTSDEVRDTHLADLENLSKLAGVFNLSPRNDKQFATLQLP
jgi:hypothetical protein